MFLIIISSIVLFGIAYFFINDKYLLPQKIVQIKKLMDDDQFDEAMKIVNVLPEKMKIHPEIQYIIYQIYLKQKQYFMAIFHLTEILKRNNYTEQITETILHENIAEVYELMDKKKKALEEYSEVLKTEPEHLKANQKVGEILYFLKNFGAALPYLEKAYELDSQNGVICKYLAEVYILNEEFGKAIHMADHALNLGVKEPEIYMSRSIGNLHNEKYKEAISDVDKIDIGTPQSNLGQIIKGLAHFHLKEKTKAFDIFSSFLMKFTENHQTHIIEARYFYSEMLAEKGKVKDSLRQLYFIQNSGKQHKDVAHKIPVYNKIVSSKRMSDYVEKEIESFIHKNLDRGLSTNGHNIIKLDTLTKKQAVVTTKKNTSSGTVLMSIIGIDMALKDPSTDLLDRLINAALSANLSSVYLFTFFPLTPAQKTNISQTTIEVEILEFTAFENIISGKQSL
jgi:tetratricopeptide (TPR) repeat protein